MTNQEKYWLAGILEGEGSFMKGPPSQPNMPRIALQMCDKDIVERVSDLFGIEYIHEQDPRKENWSVSYKIAVKGRPAVEIMRLIKPIMGQRRTTQIEEAIASYDEYKEPESRSDYSRERVKRAWNLIERGESLIEVSERLDMKYQFVKDLNTGRTWTTLTGL